MKDLIIAIFFIGLSLTINAQTHGNGHANPDSLDEITVSGTAIVIETNMNTIYYLDENGDGTAEYHLNFGPHWFSPDSSAAVRPNHGDVITVTGGVHESFNMEEATIIVYEINGELWRDPYFAKWNNLGSHSHQMGGHHGGMMGYGFGWEHDTVTTIETSGKVLIDTTFVMNHFQLDVDDDSYPDYYLNFGPYWYEPESGIERPINGEIISIKAGLIETSMNLPMLIIYEINGEIWRDSLSIGNHFGGGWFHAEMSDSQTFHSPFDMHDQMTIRSGWNGQGSHGHMGGMNNFDSLFCQILEVYPENIPNMQNMEYVLGGYEIDMFDPNGNNWMQNGGMMGGHMQFASNVKYQMHYSDKQLEHYNADETSIHAKYWDDQLNDWVDANASLNTESNTVTFDNNIVSNFVVLEFSKVTSEKNSDELTPKGFTLSQNYPNPFNPSTMISYEIPEQSNIKLEIFNMLGQSVGVLVNSQKSSGFYETTWNAENLPSGIYLISIRAEGLDSKNSFTQVKKALLLK
jgi:hypothetical protein